MMQDESIGTLAKEFDGLIAKSQVSSWMKQPPQGVGVVEVIIASTSRSISEHKRNSCNSRRRKVKSPMSTTTTSKTLQSSMIGAKRYR
jgi:hypothetical protein